MDLWQRARGFAEEAARRSQEISKEAAKRSQELTMGAARFSQEFVTETAKKSKELAAEASKKAELLRIEALKRADQIKSLAGEIEIPIPPIGPGALLPGRDAAAGGGSEQQQQQLQAGEELERFGVTVELREFVKGITVSTFRDFPTEDELEISDVPLVSNVRQDLNEWQARHATLVLSTVKEISKLRYDLCPRYMKEKKFWRIYFILVNSYVAQYEKKYMEESKLKKAQEKTDKAKENETTALTSKLDVKDPKLQSNISTSSTAEHDLDIFLLGDLGSSDDGGPDDDNDGFDDDFDKIDDSMALNSDNDTEKADK